ncbi:MAG TPA: phosphoadenylyl-sulfate reductase [Mycobacteriales bacterium]
MSAPASEHPRLAALARRAGEELEGAQPTEVLRFAAEEFGDRLCVTSSMADALLAHLASSVLPGIDVLFLDTGYHFAETLGTRDAVAGTLPVNVITVTPEQTVAEQDARYGPRLYERDPDLCCALRKVAPLARALEPYHAWASGIRRDESITRQNVRVVEWDARRGLVKVNPLACWTQADVDAYAAEHGVLINPLVQVGYRSVGCAPCTRPVADGEDQRSGRWAGTGKTECGLHT